MGITILPRDYNPWVQALPGFLQNIAFQKMAQRFTGSESEKDREANRETTTAGLQKEGYVEYTPPTIEQLGGPYSGYGQGTIPEPTPDVSYGGKQFMEPQVYAKYQQLPGGGTQPVFYRKKYGQTEAQATPTKFGTAIKPTNPTNAVREYNFAMNQYLTGKGKFPGSFTNWKKAMRKAGASKISIGEKVEEARQKSDVKIEQSVKSTTFPDKVTRTLKTRMGDDWEMLDEFTKQERIFREMDRQIREVVAYKDAVFDERNGVEGWWVGNKLIRRWVDPNKHRSDKRH